MSSRRRCRLDGPGPGPGGKSKILARLPSSALRRCRRAGCPTPARPCGDFGEAEIDLYAAVRVKMLQAWIAHRDLQGAACRPGGHRHHHGEHVTQNRAAVRIHCVFNSEKGHWLGLVNILAGGRESNLVVLGKDQRDALESNSRLRRATEKYRPCSKYACVHVFRSAGRSLPLAWSKGAVSFLVPKQPTAHNAGAPTSSVRATRFHAHLLAFSRAVSYPRTNAFPGRMVSE